jgi:carbon-monoxide dehydrogenase large subunit
MTLTGPGGGPIFIGPHLLLPAGKARHLGEAVVMVVAETEEQASAEAVHIGHEELPFITEQRAALAPRAPAVAGEEKR